MQMPLFLKPSGRYQLVVLGAILLAVVLALSLRAVLMASGTAGHSYGGIDAIDVPLALLITASSSIVFAGLWKIYPETAAGQWLLRAAIAVLVLLNLTAWGFALWLS